MTNLQRALATWAAIVGVAGPAAFLATRDDFDAEMFEVENYGVVEVHVPYRDGLPMNAASICNALGHPCLKADEPDGSTSICAQEHTAGAEWTAVCEKMPEVGS